MLSFSSHLLSRYTIIVTIARNGIAESQAQDLREPALQPSFADLHISPKKRKGIPEDLVEENSFPRQRSYGHVTAKFAEWRAECRREKEGCKENKLLQLPATTCSIGDTNLTVVGREFHETEANFETRKIR